MPWYPKFLLFFVGLSWLLITLNATDIYYWLLETIVDLIFITILIVTYKRFAFSNLAYTLAALYILLHFIGGYYGYAHVPFGFWLGSIIGTTRNMYDRLMHFASGFLMYVFFAEIISQKGTTNMHWTKYFSLVNILALSALYEVFEYLAALYVNPALKEAFLASQGDIWDTQNDMLLAIIGGFSMFSIVEIYRKFYSKTNNLGA